MGSILATPCRDVAFLATKFSDFFFKKETWNNQNISDNVLPLSMDGVAITALQAWDLTLLLQELVSLYMLVLSRSSMAAEMIMNECVREEKEKIYVSIILPWAASLMLCKRFLHWLHIKHHVHRYS